MATFPAVYMFLRHKEVPSSFGPAMNSFWYLICNNILVYCERLEELAILISRLLLRMCGIYLSSRLFFTFTQNYARLELRSLFHSLFATLRLRGRPARDGCESALWDYFGGRIFNMVANSSSKQSHNTLWQPSQTGLPRNLKVADRVFSDDVTAAMLVSQSSPVGGELVCYANAFVCCNKFAHMLATWVKTLYNPA